MYIRQKNIKRLKEGSHRLIIHKRQLTQNGFCYVVFNSRSFNGFNNCTFWSIIVQITHAPVLASWKVKILYMKTPFSQLYRSSVIHVWVVCHVAESKNAHKSKTMIGSLKTRTRNPKTWGFWNQFVSTFDIFFWLSWSSHLILINCAVYIWYPHPVCHQHIEILVLVSDRIFRVICSLSHVTGPCK
jgi:hypothetical protein